jgi:hypothetical protein
MAGDTLMPPLVLHRKTVDETVWEEGRRNGQDFLLYSKDTSSLIRDIFKDYLRKGFLKHGTTVGGSINLRDSPVIFLCDDCTAHIEE